MSRIEEVRRSLLRGPVTIACGALVMVLTGCSQNAVQPPLEEVSSPADLGTGVESMTSSPASAGSSGLAPVAAGAVTFEAYEAAVLEFRQCMEDAGFQFADFQLDETERVYRWLVNSNGSDGPAATCYAKFEPTDIEWQRAVSGPREDAMRASLEACLDREGLAYDDTMNSGALTFLLRGNGIDWVADC